MTEIDHCFDKFPAPDIFTESSSIVAGDQETSAIYEPLAPGHIRLLEIISGPDAQTGDIHCRLHNHLLDKHLKYTALSYAWGSPPDVETIIVNGRRIPVRKNLWWFLREARDIPRNALDLLWVDAICINQRSPSERMHQVGLMADIFRGAGQVIVWLGPAHSGSNEVMKGLSRQSATWKAKLQSLNIPNPLMSALASFCWRTYWRRLWVLQEILLASRIVLMCGARFAPWESFLNMAIRMDDRERAPDLSKRSTRKEDSIEYQAIRNSPALPLALQTQRDARSSNLYDLMLATRYLRCSEPRDRVYALLGITYQSEQMTPDYSKPIPVLLNEVLRAHHELEPVQSKKELAGQCYELTRLFELRSESLFNLVDGYGCFPPPRHVMLENPLRWAQSGMTLWWAAFYNHSRIKALLLQDVHADVLSSWLKAASRSGHQQIVLMLLDGSGNIGSLEMERALHLASRNGHEQVVRLLLDQGVDVDCLGSPTGSRPEGSALQTAVRSPESNISVVKLLLARGAQVNKRGTEDLTALHWASARGYMKTFWELVKHGAEIRARDYWGRSSLHFGTYFGHEKVVRLLLMLGAHVDTRTRFGWTPLHIASHLNREEMVRLFLNHGADVNAMDAEFITAIEEASQLAIVKLLYEHGASIKPNCSKRLASMSYALHIHRINPDATPNRTARTSTVSIFPNLRKIWCRIRLGQSYLGP